MRWLLLDQFTRIYRGQTAQALRYVTRSEDALTHPYPAFPVMPPSLMLEMMAQVGGVLVGATIDFTKEVVLAKISDATFYLRVTPPAVLKINAKLLDLGDRAARTECDITSDGKKIGAGTIFFGLFDELESSGGKSVVFSENFLETFCIKQIAAQCEGSPAHE